MDWWSTLCPQCLLRLMLLREMSLFPLLSLTCLPAVCPRAAFKSLPGSSQETTNRCYPSLTAFALLDNTPSVVNISFVTSGSCFFLLVFIAKPLRERRRKLRNWDFGVNTLSLCEGGKEQRSEWKTGRHKGKTGELMCASSCNIFSWMPLIWASEFLVVFGLRAKAVCWKHVEHLTSAHTFYSSHSSSLKQHSICSFWFSVTIHVHSLHHDQRQHLLSKQAHTLMGWG